MGPLIAVMHCPLAKAVGANHTEEECQQHSEWAELLPVNSDRLAKRTIHYNQAELLELYHKFRKQGTKKVLLRIAKEDVK